MLQLSNVVQRGAADRPAGVPFVSAGTSPIARSLTRGAVRLLGIDVSNYRARRSGGHVKINDQLTRVLLVKNTTFVQIFK